MSLALQQDRASSGRVGGRGAGVATVEPRPSATASNAYLLVPILLVFILLTIAVIRSPNLISSAGIGSAVIVAAPLILATYALTAIAMAGRGGVDLSIGPLIGFLNVTLVELNGLGIVTTPFEVFAYVIGVGVAYQLLMGLIIVFVRVQPIIVSLSGFLALAGINLVIMQRPGGTAPDWMTHWGLGTSIFSPVLLIIALATVAWLIFARTAFFGHLRLMGADERAAYASGVRINLVRLGAHVIAGVYAGLAALTYTSLIGSGDPTQGSTYTLMAVTALVLGGTSLAGGRGGAIGSLFGALNIYLITYVLATFSFGMIQSFVTDLAYGLMLVLSLLLSIVVPKMQREIRPISPFLFFVALLIPALGVIVHTHYDYSAPGAVSEEAVPSAEPAEAAETPPVAEAPPDAWDRASSRVFIFEDMRSDVRAAGRPAFVEPIAYGALLLVSLVFVLRLAVRQGAVRTLSPLVFIVALGVVILGVYLLAQRVGR